jgi:transcriptional regulator with XRE-family HTH domain
MFSLGMSTETTSFLRIYRGAAGLTQVDLAAQIKRSPAFVSRVENGGPATLTPAIAEKIGAVVGVAPAILFGRDSR